MVLDVALELRPAEEVQLKLTERGLSDFVHQAWGEARGKEMEVPGRVETRRE